MIVWKGVIHVKNTCTDCAHCIEDDLYGESFSCDHCLCMLMRVSPELLLENKLGLPVIQMIFMEE